MTDHRAKTRGTGVRLFDTRKRDGIPEIVTEIVTGRTARWEPLVNVLVRTRYLEFGSTVYPLSFEEALLQAGWIPPDAELEPYLCDANPPLLAHKLIRDRRCRRRAGHDGYHQDGNFRWEP
jgi:hypothetical protein